MGSTLGGWTEAFIMVSMFLILLSGVIVEMNMLYTPDEDVDIKLLSDFDDLAISGQTNTYVDSASSTLDKAQVEKGDSGGLSLMDAWTLTNSIRRLIWNGISGAWIETIIIYYLGLPNAIAYLLRGLWITSIVFGIIRLFMKVTP